MKWRDCAVGAGLAMILVAGANAHAGGSSRIADFKVQAVGAVTRLCASDGKEVGAGQACIGRLLDLAGDVIALAKQL